MPFVILSFLILGIVITLVKYSLNSRPVKFEINVLLMYLSVCVLVIFSFDMFDNMLDERSLYGLDMMVEGKGMELIGGNLIGLASMVMLFLMFYRRDN